MSNTLTLGLHSPGNALALEVNPAAIGVSYGLATAVGVPIHNGLAVGAATASGIALVTILAIGSASGDAIVTVGQGLSNRGAGLSHGEATVFANNALALGLAEGLATVLGVGASHSEFAPYFMWPGYSSDGTVLNIPLADIDPILDAVAADAATGDWRKIVQALCMTASAHYQTLADSDEGAPLTARARVFYNYSARHAAFGNTLKRTAVYQVHIDHETGDIANEPN